MFTNDTFQLSHISFDFVQQLLAHCTSDHLATVCSFFSLRASLCHRQRYLILSFDHWQTPLVVLKTVREKWKKIVLNIFCVRISGNRYLCAMFSALFTITQLLEFNFKAYLFGCLVIHFKLINHLYCIILLDILSNYWDLYYEITDYGHLIFTNIKYFGQLGRSAE